MITVHHLGRSQSERIVWLCEELELPYQFRRYDREANGAAPPEYKAMHPFGTAPVITDGDLVLGESGAIVEYLCRRHAGGRLMLGPEHPEFAPYLYWFHFANATFVASGMMEVIRQRLGAPPASDRGDRAFAMAEERLGKTPYFGGEELTAADIMMLFPMTTMRLHLQRELGPYLNISAYLRRIGARPAYRRAMAKAEPDLPLDPT